MKLSAFKVLVLKHPKNGDNTEIIKQGTDDVRIVLAKCSKTAELKVANSLKEVDFNEVEIIVRTF